MTSVDSRLGWGILAQGGDPDIPHKPARPDWLVWNI
jgi:hypothetical protein